MAKDHQKLTDSWADQAQKCRPIFQKFSENIQKISELNFRNFLKFSEMKILKNAFSEIFISESFQNFLKTDDLRRQFWPLFSQEVAVSWRKASCQRIPATFMSPLRGDLPFWPKMENKIFQKFWKIFDKFFIFEKFTKFFNN